MRDRGLNLKALTLTAKDKICFEPEAACNGEECPYARGFHDRIQGAVEDLFTGGDALDRDAVEAAAKAHRVCPFELSLELARWADVIICDYNYAFDPRVYLRRFFLEDPDHYVFLIDEAHNLVDRARDAAGLRQIYEILDELEPVESDVEIIRPVRELFYWPMGLAYTLALLAGHGRCACERHQHAKAGQHQHCDKQVEVFHGDTP